MRPGRTRLATATVALAIACLLVPEAVAAKEPPKFPTQGTDALARSSWIVTLKDGADVALAARMSRQAGGKAGLKYTYALIGFQFKGSAKAAAALAKNPRVAAVTPDHAIHLTEIAPNGILRIHAWNPVGGAYQAGYRGAGARIAILDTGIDLTHPDLAASIDGASGKNCLNPALPPQDGHGHGTHVSGTAAAPLNGVGVVGVAPEATLVAIKMFDDAGNSSEALSLCALDRVTELNSDANPNNDIDVVNMSWGEHRSWGSCATDPLHGAICRARTSGAILVAGAGNDAVDAGDFVPAAFPEVISVSGYTDFDGQPGGAAGCQFVQSLFWMECDDTFAFFSDFGPSVDVIAPSVNVYSTWTGGGYQTLDGTSMATPHVAGVVALMRSANPSLTPSEALDVLLATGECPNGEAANADGVWGCDGQGTWQDDPDGIPEPLPNALRAAQTAIDPPPPPPPPRQGTFDIPGVQGDWVGTYGTDGYALLAWNGNSDLVNLPGASLTLDQDGRATWTTSTTDNRALQSPDQSQRRAMTWWGNAQIRAHLTFTAAYTGTLHLYAVDWDTVDRRETITVNDGTGPQQVSLSATFHDGAWLHFPISVPAGGQVTITVDRLGGANAVLSGLFLGGGQQQPPANPPGAPTLNTATPGNGQVSLAWSAPASNGGSAITGYTATASPGGATCTTAGTTTCTVGGLSNGTSYSFTVTATNAAGTGLASNALSATPRTVPGAPTLNSATPGNGQVALAWSAPASNGGSTITGYTATASPGGATCSTSGALTCSVAGLANGTSYSFTVTATNAAGTGVASNVLSATPTGAATPPGAPTLNSATAGNGQVALSWAAPSSDGGSAITGYTATASPGGATCSTAGATACTASGLTNGTSYSFSVAASNGVGTGPASNVLSATPRTVPGAPTLNAATPGNAQVTLAWTAPASNGGSPVTGYTATASPGGVTCSTAGTLGCTVTGLTNGTSYSFTVTATNAAGTGAASNTLSATPRTVPGAPTLNSATAGDTQVALVWTAPASNGGSPITGYTATASPGGATCSTSGALTCSITGLINGTAYSFSVIATNAAGTSAASNSLNATPRTVPGAPQSLTAAPNKAKGVDLAWAAPSTNGGSAITGYKIYRRTSGGSYLQIATVSASTLTYRDATTTRSTQYFYVVRATNAAGDSVASNEAGAIAK